MRLILDDAKDAFTNMAIDEAIMMNREPTLRLYYWSPPSVSIGYFQSLDAEVDTNRCRDYGIDFVRRITGGGAVYHDKELTYSFIVPETLVSSDIIKSYEQICGAVVHGLRLHSINAEFVPINDIIVSGKKISGSAQTRKDGMVLQHGTILLDVDVDKMFSVLKVPDEKLRGKMIETVKERVTSLKMLGKSTEGLRMNIASSFESFLKIKLLRSELTPEERQAASTFRARFVSDSWNNKR